MHNTDLSEQSPFNPLISKSAACYKMIKMAALLFCGSDTIYGGHVPPARESRLLDM